MKKSNNYFRSYEDDEDGPNFSSFTKSKVDDDDDRFRRGYMDQEFLDAFLIKKQRPTKNPTALESPSNLLESIKTNPSNPTTPPKSDKQIFSKTDQRNTSGKQIPTTQTPPIQPTRGKETPAEKKSMDNTPKKPQTPQLDVKPKANEPGSTQLPSFRPSISDPLNNPAKAGDSPLQKPSQQPPQRPPPQLDTPVAPKDRTPQKAEEPKSNPRTPAPAKTTAPQTQTPQDQNSKKQTPGSQKPVSQLTPNTNFQQKQEDQKPENPQPAQPVTTTPARTDTKKPTLPTPQKTPEPSKPPIVQPKTPLNQTPQNQDQLKPRQGSESKTPQKNAVEPSPAKTPQQQDQPQQAKQTPQTKQQRPTPQKNQENHAQPMNQTAQQTPKQQPQPQQPHTPQTPSQQPSQPQPTSQQKTPVKPNPTPTKVQEQHQSGKKEQLNGPSQFDKQPDINKINLPEKKKRLADSDQEETKDDTGIKKPQPAKKVTIIQQIGKTQDQECPAPVVGDNRPAFVRRGKPQAKDVINQVKGQPDQRIRSIEPRNYIEVNKELTLRKCVPTRQEYDPIFPPNVRQICQTKQRSITLHHDVAFQRIDFGRPNELIAVVDPNDIEPGEFSNSLVSALSAAAEQPSIFQRIFEDQTLNPAGYYVTRLFIDGVWKYIVIDDSIAMVGQKPLVSATSLDARIKSLSKSAPGYESELWPFLIEKALAKTYGTYEDMLSMSYLRDQLSEITGAPVISLQFDEALASKFPKSFVGLLALNQPEFPRALTYLGYDQGKKELILRNPWGWKGAAPKSANPEGEFRIPVSQAKGSTLTVAKYYENYYWVSHGVRQIVDGYSCYEVRITEPTHCFFTLYQKDERYFRNNIVKKYNYSFARVYIFNEDNELIGRSVGEEKAVSAELNLEKGNYWVVVAIDWQQLYDCTLTYYGSSNIELSRLNYKDDPNLFAALIGIEALGKGRRTIIDKEISEYWWESREDRLLTICWRYTGQTPRKWTRSLKQVDNKEFWMPLSFINSKDKIHVMDMKTEDMLRSRNEGWWNADEVEIEFPANSYYSAVFKDRE